MYKNMILVHLMIIIAFSIFIIKVSINLFLMMHFSLNKFIIIISIN